MKFFKDKATIILVFVLVIGLSLLLYPSVSNYWNTRLYEKAISNYKDEVKQIRPENIVKMLEAAEEYNKKLVSKEYPWSMTDEEMAEYNSLLNTSESGIIGFIDVPVAKIYLPIYHGTDEKHLQIGAGHIETSSLPIGGESTHAVISGHRGLPSARLFTDLDMLEEGDKFQITVLDNVVSYEVDRISIVVPEDMSELGIEPGKDYVTLVTCTPYGVNSHRLLVRGHRISNLEYDSSGMVSEASLIDTILVAPFIAIPIIAILIILMLIKTRRKPNNKDKKKRNNKKRRKNNEED